MYRKKTEVSELPVMLACCKSCPFKEINGRQQHPETANAVISRNLFNSQQICHSTEGKNRQANNRCKGYFDFAFTIYKRMGFDPEKNLKNYVIPKQ